MNTKLLALTVAIAVSLSACGGGGGGGGGAPSAAVAPANIQPDIGGQPPASNAISDTGSVEAPFVRGTAARFILDGPTGQMAGNPSPVTQTSDGAITGLGTNTLTGTPIAIQDISGNANFAQGRWNVGIATTGTSTTTLTGKSADSYHYVVFNYLPALPAAGTMTCNAGKFTKPNYTGGGISPGQPGYLGTSTGSASLTFDGSGAHVTLSVTATVGSTNGSADMPGTISKIDQMYIHGPLSGPGSGGAVMLGDAGNGAVFVITNYQVTLANNNVYRGIATFTCH